MVTSLLDSELNLSKTSLKLHLLGDMCLEEEEEEGLSKLILSLTLSPKDLGRFARYFSFEKG